MLNFGIEVLFMAALAVVFIIIILFYLVVVRSESQAKLASVELPERQETESAEALEEVTEGPSVEAPERPEIVPAEPPLETVSFEPPERLEAAPVEAERETGPPGPLGCPYHLGYLKKRPKDALIPDACLGCPRILECLEKEWLGE